MKKTIITLLMCAAGIGAAAQTSSQNYILTRRMINETAGDYTDLVTYYDGLGRPFEEVTKHARQGSVTERHATLQEYDYLGRPVRSWLPASVVIDYNAPATLKSYAQGSDKGYNDTRPYTETVYELSTADRVMMQYGPGAAWYSAHPVSDEYTGNPVATQYTTNTASGVQSCKVYGVSGNSLTGGSTYHTAGTLHVVKTTDEDGRVSYTFTTGDGLTLLERRMNGTAEQLDTYYVYDNLGRLRFVLQPMYQSTASTDQYAFEFRYNEKGLCTYRKNPGAQYVTYEYDWKDRLAYTQDGVQRSSGKWTFYTYDGVGRPSSQGENTSKASSTSAEYLKNYYDNYNFVGSTGFTSSLYTSDTSLSGWGKLTGQVIGIPGSSTKIYVAYYYDAKGRVKRKVESNLLGGHEVTETTYTFTGNPLEVTHTHTASGKTTRTEKYTYVYDAAERVSSIKHKLGSTEVTLASYTYDKHGRMSRRNFHGNYSSEQIYSYNVRSWLTGISSAKFTQTLGYSGLYGGDIKTMSWTANGSSHSYTFGYDGVGRMKNANHGAGAYSELVTSYDKNGNIKALKRTCGSSTLADDLTYTYSGNRITKVEDAADNSGLFKNGSTATTEYTYDNNGNLTKDLNKGISNITYNCLNLPLSMTFSNGSTIAYTYDANGRKLRTVHNVGGTTTTTDYAGNVIYENGVQKKLLTEEGYVDLTTGTYYYYLKDHQGNNRVVVNSGGTVTETNHYYPFGGTFASGTVQPYKYNGKELDTKAGLNWYDYGARHYDAALGRFTTQDPLAEKYFSTSPYGYCLNNPVKFVDPDGKKIRPGNPVRRGYRNGGRPNPYAFYPNGIRPQSYRMVNKVSYKGTGLYEQIALGEQNYVTDVTVGDNTVQMSRNNSMGIRLTGRIGLFNNAKEFSERLLDMSVETIYHDDGRKSTNTNYQILDERLAELQREYAARYNQLSMQLGNNLTFLEKNAIIQKELGMSPLLQVIMNMLMNPTDYNMESQREIMPEFRQGN